MHLYLLPGNSPKTRSWIETIAGQFQQGLTGTEIQYYRHWQTGDKSIFFDEEVESAATTLSNPLTDHIVFAKSVGVAVTVAATNTETKPAACIFVGTPLDVLADRGLDLGDWHAKWRIPTLYIQQTDDPLTAYAALAEKVDSLDNVTTVEVSGNDHAYSNTDELSSHVGPFIEQWKNSYDIT